MSNVAINEAQADFAVKLLQQSSQANQNASVIISPISIAVALSMVYAGAKEETKTQLAKLIANGASDEEINKHFGAVVQQLSAEHKNYTLETANRVYVQEGFSVVEAFKDIIGRHYLGQFQQLDFKENVKAAKEINDFVEKKTHEKIKDLIPSDALDESTRLVLVNAIYFKGTWEKKFDKELTKKKPFFIAEGNEKEVDMMHLKTDFIYFEDDDAQVLGLPYDGGELFMYVILPRERFGLQKLLGSLSGKKLAEYIGKRHKTEVTVQLPRFKVETSLSLKKALSDLGLSNAFSNDANFKGINEEVPLKISEVFHKAFVETNEEGSEAAAATGIVVMPMSLTFPPEKPLTFVADHAFLYAISNETNEEGSEAAAATAMKMMLLSASIGHQEPLRFIADHAFMYAISNKAGDVLFFGHVSHFR